MMLGVLVGMWTVPVMSISQFVMSSLFTIYVAVGIILEEKELIKQFGTTYKEYKKQIATFIPEVL